jgi:adenine-specific DNA-methyltransferase
MRFIGSKIRLLDNIKEVVFRHAPEASSFCDIFSGSAAVARFFKQWCEIYSNDLMFFSHVLQKATIEMPNMPSFETLANTIETNDPVSYLNNIGISKMEHLPQEKRFFQNNYAPTGGRMYVTDINALRIDYTRNIIENWKTDNLITDLEYYYLVACVVEGIPFVSNISGTYGAYNKEWDRRSSKKFKLVELPVIFNGMNNKAFNEDGATLLKRLSGDVLYIDPPYNERQYPPNYHVLETAAKYDFPELKGVTGLRPYETQKSEFCSRKTAVNAFDEMINNAKFQHIVLSYNTDGIMTLDEITEVMKSHGIPETFEVNYIPYRRFKSQNGTTRSKALKEMLIYIEKEV